MTPTIYSVRLGRVGARIEVLGTPSPSLTRLAGRTRTLLLRHVFVGRSLLLMEGAGAGPQYTWDLCDGRAVTSRRLLGQKYWLTAIASATEACVEKVALDDRMDYGGLGVAAVTPHEAISLGDRIASAFFSRQWPISDPLRVESMHATADGLQIWWGNPTETDRADRALSDFAAKARVEIRFVTAKSPDELLDTSFVG